MSSDWITKEKENVYPNYTFVKIYLYQFRAKKKRESSKITPSFHFTIVQMVMKQNINTCLHNLTPTGRQDFDCLVNHICAKAISEHIPLTSDVILPSTLISVSCE